MALELREIRLWQAMQLCLNIYCQVAKIFYLFYRSLGTGAKITFTLFKIVFNFYFSEQKYNEKQSCLKDMEEMVGTGEGWEGFSVNNTVTVDPMCQTGFDEVSFVSAPCSCDNSLVCNSLNSHF